MNVRQTSRVGELVLVMGMVGRDESGGLVTGVTSQTEHALRRVESALAAHACGLADIVRLRVYLTSIADWPTVCDEISKALGDDWPPTAVVEVTALVDPAMLVELEVDAAAP